MDNKKQPELGEAYQDPRYPTMEKTVTSNQSPEVICSVCEQIAPQI